LIVDAAVCAFVAIESVTVCGEAPGVIGPDGAKEAAAPAGSGVDRLNVTGSENVPCEGEMVKANVAVCPAVTEIDELCEATEKSVTVKLIAEEAPPPGGGFMTVISNVPPWETSLGSKVA
jgi:hypothetical protein